MLTRISNIEELKQIFAEGFFNKTDSVTKISDNSVLNGIAYGCSKIGQKALKDIALVESHILPDNAFGEHLDSIAERRGIAPRFLASESSTYLRLVADEGTQYQVATNSFVSNSGITFNLESDVTIGAIGYTYAKVRSQETGGRTNVDVLDINTVTPVPTGHTYVINEAIAIGGRDVESDDLFRKRIKEGPNILAKNTLAYMAQVMNKINNNILRVLYNGIDANGKLILRLVSQNGIDFSPSELDDLLAQSRNYFSFTDHKPYAEDYEGVELDNVEFHPIDVSLRAKLKDDVDPDDVRRDLQIKMSKYLDWRFWTSDKKVLWDDLFLIAKNNTGIDYIADQFFYPNVDITIDKNKLPRLRGFILMDLEGNVISDISGVLNPAYYPANPDFSFQASLLTDI